ncbi:relaxase/mobilization nuclease domain-containing protein [Pedobacter aquatilis]|uniref:relaxase/mobilization nuclease domain-containing protein n=1 Tax=Pedobacter aquatilis TaxID=351343 RepID=UPI00292F23A0|nr:relaxase/mobilization nuclease domain-containing protein [Pedobacter aquatilis]
MVAKIITGKSIRGILHYNENKVDAGQARLIMASGFAADIEIMNFMQKHNRFKHLTDLSPRVKTNAVHISLNFHPNEHPNDEKLQAITLDYMEAIGFSEQPFLVYRHEDSAHPHVHIVTTCINREGNRMDLHDIGKKISEPARKAIEEKYDLIRAEGLEKPIRAKLEKLDYGTVPTKSTLSNLVTRVSQEFAYGSFAEYKAVLAHFGVMADTGAPGSRMFEKRGLQYFLTSSDGQAKGIPIKASSISAKPTMANLHKRFKRNMEKKQSHKPELKAILDKILSTKKLFTIPEFTASLLSENLIPIFRRSPQGLLYGISYIDLFRKVIFNGSELGKAYSAKLISVKLSSPAEINSSLSISLNKNSKHSHNEFSIDKHKIYSLPLSNDLTTSNEPAPIGVIKRRKKRRKGKKIVQEIDHRL